MISLLKTLFQKSFLGLFIAQFLGAFNDNFFRTAMATFITYKVTSISAQTKSVTVALAVALFMFPYFLFSAQAGELADRYRKDIIIKTAKFVEVIIAILAGIGFVYQNIPLLLFVLFLMGTQSTFFGPSKYSILPNLLPEKQLIAGNGLIEAGTYAAILQGTIFGGLIISLTHFNLFGFNIGFTDKAIPIIILTVSIIGFISSLFIPKQQIANKDLVVDKNFIRSTFKNISFAKQSHNIFLCILGISWFWLLGTALISQIPTLAQSVLYGNPGLFTFLLTLFSCGIGIGSLICQFLVKGEITSKYVPITSILMTIFLADLAIAISGYKPMLSEVDYKTFLSTFVGKRITFDLLFFAISGGLYIVPLNTMLQSLATEKSRARVIASNNIINSLFMVVGSGICALFFKLGFSIVGIFAFIAIINFLVAIYICGLLPHHIIRMVISKILNFVYGVEIKGIENYKNLKGNAIIVANHTSFLDAVLIWTYLEGNLYFAIDTYISKKWWVKPFLHLAKYFPIDPTSPMAVKSIIEEVKKGHQVVIFPEGRITTTGGLMKIFPGPAMIADKSKSQILPICLEGSQYSIFSRFGTSLKTRPQSKITITVLPTVSLNIDENIKGKKRRLDSARKLYDIMVNMKYNAGNTNETLFDSLLDAQQLVGRNKKIIEDINRKPISFGKFLTLCFVLGKKFKKENNKSDYIGLMLPNSTVAVASFFGLQAFNLIPCMLNFSTGTKNMLACCRSAKINKVYTSKEFITKGNLLDVVEKMKQDNIEIVYLEDMSKKITVIDKFVALLMSFVPRTYYKKIRNNVKPTDPAVVLFTSGSEGTPKGVVLSHQNIQANRIQLQTVLDFGINDKVFNAMPIFHSFGLTGGTLLPLLSAIPVFFYPTPLHYRIVPELIYDTNSTIMFGTDTFLNGYAKMAHPFDFYSIKLAVVGAEKLKEETMMKYYDTFGMRIMEGYGATETAPALAINTPMYFKRGTVGRLLPGIEYKLETIPGVENAGKLLVKGKNIMLGYLRISNPGVIEQPTDGWYDTGDIVSIDSEEFIKIQGRAKRFAKIAGEMVSLSAVETEISQLWQGFNHAIVNIPDEKKGEQLVLFTTKKDATRKDILEYFKLKGLSELSVPKVVKILDEIPLMGTGKTNYVKLKEMSLEIK